MSPDRGVQVHYLEHDAARMHAQTMGLAPIT